MVDKKELAKHFNVSIPTIDRLMKDGMPYYKIGRLVRFKLEEVENYLKEEK